MLISSPYKIFIKQFIILIKLIDNMLSFQNQITGELDQMKLHLIRDYEQQMQQISVQYSDKISEKMIIDEDSQQKPFETKKVSTDNSFYQNQSTIKLSKRSELAQLKDFNNRTGKQLYLSDLISINDKQDCNSKGEQYLNFYEKEEDKDLTHQSETHRFQKLFSSTRNLSKIQEQHMHKNTHTSKKNLLLKKKSMIQCDSSQNQTKELYSKLFCEISESFSPRNVTILDDNTNIVNIEDSNIQKLIINAQTRTKIAQKIANQLVISQKFNKQQSNRNQKYQKSNSMMNSYELQLKLRSELLKKIVLLKSINHQ